MATRRHFLATLGATASGTAKTVPRIVANTYIWTQEFARRKIPLSEGWEEAFAAIARAGYQWVELAADWFPEPEHARTARQLDKYKLRLSELYSGGTLHDDREAELSIARTIELADWAKSLGCTTFLIDLNAKPQRARKTDEEIATEARNLNRLGAEMRSRGVTLALHNHDDPMRDNAREWRYVLQNTDPALVSICLDPDWTWQAGTDPMPLFHEAGRRLRLIHLRTQKHKLWTEALEEGGDIDYAKVTAHLRRTGYDGYLVVELAHRPETRITRSVEENIRLSRLWVERVLAL